MANIFQSKQKFLHITFVCDVLQIHGKRRKKFYGFTYQGIKNNLQV